MLNAIELKGKFEMHGSHGVDWIDLDMRMKLMRISGKLVLIENQGGSSFERQLVIVLLNGTLEESDREPLSEQHVPIKLH